MKTIVGITEVLDENKLSKLDGFVIHYNRVLKKLYVDLYIKKLNLNTLKTSYIKKYDISGRQFNSMRFLLQGKISSILALNKTYIAYTKDKIKHI
jgi:hypothetical protein